MSIDISFVNLHILLLVFALCGVVVWLVVDIIRPRKRCPDCERSEG